MSSARQNNLRSLIASRRALQQSNRRRELLMAGVGSTLALAAACLLAAFLFQVNILDMFVVATSLARSGLVQNKAEPAALAGSVPLPPPPTAAAVTPTPTVRRAAAAVPLSSRTVNNLPVDSIVVVSAASRQRVREIFLQGSKLGRDPHAFSKIGDSTMAYPPFLAAFAVPGGYRLGRYAYLQPTIDYYRASFARESAAVKKGMHTWTEFDPAWVASGECAGDESPLACEVRLNNPSVVLIRLGANDVPDPASFNTYLGRILDFCLARGIVPVIGTKPDRQEGPANTLNQIARQTAARYRLPLWDYDLVVGTLPGRGLENDQIHIRGNGSHDFSSASAFSSGDSLDDLTGLMALDAVRQAAGQ